MSNINPNNAQYVVDFFRSLSLEEQHSFILQLSPDQYKFLRFRTDAFLRLEQVIPDNFKGRYWIFMTGRGWGKNKAGATHIRKAIYKKQQGILLIAPNYKDLSENMIPAIQDEFPFEHRPKFLSGSKNQLIAHNGLMIQCATSEQVPPRGQNISLCWMDEVVNFCDEIPEKAIKYFDTINFAVRKGNPLFVITTTPKRAHPLMERWEDRFMNNDPQVHIVRGASTQNQYLSPNAVQEWQNYYGNSAWGRQEMLGELLRHVEGAKWNQDQIDQSRITSDHYDYEQFIKYLTKNNKKLHSIVISIDPATTANIKTSDETGIIVLAMTSDLHLYLLADQSGIHTPLEWSDIVYNLHRQYHASAIIYESNQGGKIIEGFLQSTHKYNIPFKPVSVHQGKIVRADLASVFTEKKELWFIGNYPELEKQMTTFTGNLKDKSPDRLDALTQAVNSLRQERNYLPPLKTPPKITTY